MGMVSFKMGSGVYSWHLSLWICYTEYEAIAFKHLLMLSVKLQIYACPISPQSDICQCVTTQQGFQGSKTARQMKTWTGLDQACTASEDAAMFT